MKPCGPLLPTKVIRVVTNTFLFFKYFAIQGEMKCRILISACGALHKPITPEIEGAEQFRGDVIQLGLWEIGQHSKRIGVQYQ